MKLYIVWHHRTQYGGKDSYGPFTGRAEAERCVTTLAALPGYGATITVRDDDDDDESGDA